ncbi:MAG: hypothetical protein A2Y95_10205 [Deltaproteobacteria bacterium RBG_13_65_10]|nr:MAG: hypothetical protein A2Y95_10205 [Deltaproteobacteria bacterium RBG_13_65_10]
MKEFPSVPGMISARSSGVHPSSRPMVRTGRGSEKRMISFARTPKICPVTLPAASLARKTHSGATWVGLICLSFSTRAFCASVSVGMVPIMRVQAKGEIAFTVTP